MNNHIINHNKIKQFILAGNSYFTVINEKTKNKLTFHVIQPKDRGPHFVWATNKKSKYGFLGAIFGNMSYNWGWRRGKFTKDSVTNKSFEWLWKKIYLDSLPENIVFYHKGKCGRCSKRLTDPKSIIRGFGPHCFNILVKRWKAIQERRGCI